MVDILAFVVGGLVALAAATTVALWRALDVLRARPPRGGRRLPPMLVIRPVRGLEPGLRGNVTAALAQRYPGRLETIFVLDTPDDPAHPLLRERLARAPGRARLVFAGAVRPGLTGKLHAMIQGMRAAREPAPLVCFADSDTRPHPTLLASLARAVLAAPDIGAAFAPAVSVAPPRTAGDVGYGLLLDGIYGPEAALAMARAGSLPFIMGQTMVLRRRALDAAGGLGASAGQLVDDMDIGARLAHAGFRNVLAGPPVAVRSAGVTWSAFRSLARRWMAYSRTGIPLGAFAAPAAALGALFYGASLAAVAALALGAPGAAGLFAAAALAVPAALQGLRRRQGAAPVPLRLWWALPVALWVLPLLFLEGRRAHSVEWRGRRYVLDDAGRLAAPSARVAIRRRRAGPGERWRRDGGSTWPTAAPRDSRRSTG
jgi:ceramide glucosyltransferase